ncbi:MAG: response regulator [Pseudomonadota bacterium]
MAQKIRLIVVDDEIRFLKTLAQRLSLRDFDVTPVTSGQEAVEKAKSEDFDLALVDLKMPGMTGEEVLEALKKEHPLIEVIILTGHGSIESAVQCTHAGSYNYLQKPCETEELLEVLKNAFQRRLQRKMKLDQEKLEKMAKIAMGESPLGIMKKLKALEEKESK